MVAVCNARYGPFCGDLWGRMEGSYWAGVGGPQGSFQADLRHFRLRTTPPRKFEDKSAVSIDPSTSEVLGSSVRSHAASLDCGCCCKARYGPCCGDPGVVYKVPTGRLQSSRFRASAPVVAPSIRAPIRYKPLRNSMYREAPEDAWAPEDAGVEVFKCVLHDAHDL